VVAASEKGSRRRSAATTMEHDHGRILYTPMNGLLLCRTRSHGTVRAKVPKRQLTP
jgi:hypothetical protein